MKYILAALRFAFFVIVLIVMLILLFISFYVLQIFGKKFSVRVNYKMTMVIGWLLRLLFGVRVKIFNREKLPKESGFLMASNHLGYVELGALLKYNPVAFVAKEEISKWPFLGAVATACGTVFVNREKGGMSETYIQQTADVLDNHINVWFAPEKTTSNGTWLRPFSSALFVAANRTKKPVVPVVFVLKKRNGKPIPYEERNKIAWCTSDEGVNTPFFEHFFHSMTYLRIDLEMHVLDPVVPDYDDANIEERRKFSNMMHDRMSAELAKWEPEFDSDRIEL